ncbi:MAG TPA: response regulator, partial [Emticicia sp.]
MNQSLRIMIVEDDSLTALTIEENLKEYGYTICGKATDYQSAINLMVKESPDLVLLDIDMDGQQPDGIMIAHELLRIKPVPIIYLTGLTEFETFQRAKKTNPVAYLYKPFRPNELAIQIELALSNFYQGNRSEIISTTKCIYVPDGLNKLVRINYEGIYYMRAQRIYTDFFLTQKEAQILNPKNKYNPNTPFIYSVGFGHLLSNLPENFYKVSRSVAINLDHLLVIENSHALVGPHEIPLI